MANAGFIRASRAAEIRRPVYREIPSSNGNGAGAHAANGSRTRPRNRFSLDKRASGLLMHLTSLPGKFGNGDLGAEAYKFADFLARAGQTWWQMLPVGPPSDWPGLCPYSSYSAMAGSPWLVSLEELVEQGLLKKDDLRVEGRLARNPDDFEAGVKFRTRCLRRAFAAFESSSNHADRRNAFEEFCERESDWLADFAMFCALREEHGERPWWTWPARLRLGEPAALAQARERLGKEIRFHSFVQFQFDRQWTRFKQYCLKKGIGLIGDIPIFVAHDSADVWARRELFALDGAGRPRIVSGYPPDPFNKKGQRWGHPHFRWEAHRATDYAWWVRRFELAFRRFDAVRIDHFLGFDRCWAIPGRAPTAATGRWIAGSGAGLFEAVHRALGEDAPIIAEDLGRLTPRAAALRDRFGFPGMRVMQFAFGDGGDYHRPHNFPRGCVAYTGTHDNETIAGWFQNVSRRANRKSDAAARAERQCAMDYLGVDVRIPFHEAAIRALLMSPANLAIVPVQDILGFGNEARMNVPGVADGNWRWKLKSGEASELNAKHAGKFLRWCRIYGRVPVKSRQ